MVLAASYKFNLKCKYGACYLVSRANGAGLGLASDNLLQPFHFDSGPPVLLVNQVTSLLTEMSHTPVCRMHISVGSFVFQFTEEKFGQAEKTELDAHLENLLVRAENTKLWTERIMKQTEVLLQPNPSKNVRPC